MFELTISGQFAAAHALINYHGKCEALHGHNWKIEATVQGRDQDEAGLVIDFGQLKEMMGRVLSELDHAYLNDLPAFKGSSPSSENIARYIFERLKALLDESGVKLSRVTAWESETSRVSYLGPDA